MKMILGNYFVGHIDNKFFVFQQTPVMGGIYYAAFPQEFHTLEDAHQFLIETAKEVMTDNVKVQCVEVVKEYMFIGCKDETP